MIVGDRLSLAMPENQTINGRDFVPSRKRSQEHFSTDSTARKPNLQGHRSLADITVFLCSGS
ncbi:MAG: hypothetical protein H7201_02955 [Candidatus Saccharibacteria bacterium]|nr:hypothetical protein [Microbacteriaceae bacterium]